MFISKLYNYCGLKNKQTREKWLEKTLASIPSGYSILDAGAGELQYKKYCSHLSYTSQDFGQYTGEGQEGFQTGTWDNSQLDIVSDILDMPVPDSSFDAVMCIEVFEHISEPARAVKEFSRVLKKDGTLIVTAPFCSITHFAPYYFANGYSKYFYEKIFTEYGFEIKEISYNGNYFEYIAQELHRVGSMAQRYSGINSLVSFCIKCFFLPSLFLLNFLSHRSRQSEELLCFGLHVVAIKK